MAIIGPLTEYCRCLRVPAKRSFSSLHRTVMHEVPLSSRRITNSKRTHIAYNQYRAWLLTIVAVDAWFATLNRRNAFLHLRSLRTPHPGYYQLRETTTPTPHILRALSTDSETRSVESVAGLLVLQCPSFCRNRGRAKTGSLRHRGPMVDLHFSTRVSPMSNNPISSPHFRPACSAASRHHFGGSLTSSQSPLIPPRTVPQCIPMLFWLLMSL
jgi:hypothetical protein